MGTATVDPVIGDLQRTVGDNVRRLREGRCLTQEALAEEMGVHRTYVGSIEVGIRNLTLQTVEDVASKLGVDPLVLLTRRP